MNENNVLKKFLNNDYVFSVISKIISIVVGVFHAAFLARFLGPELKGVAASITSIVSVGSVVVTVGMHQAFPYYRKNDASQECLDKFCSTIAVSYGFLLFVAGVLAIVLPVDFVTKISILLIPLFGYETIINYVFLIESPKKRNFTYIMASCIETIILFVFWCFFQPGYSLMIIGISAAVIIRMIVSTFKVGFHFCLKKIQLSYFIGLLKFGWIPMIALLLTMLNSRLDILMLNVFPYINSYQIGIYSAGVGLAEKALFIPDAIREILLGRLVAGKEEEEVARACRIGIAIACLITIGILVFGKLIIKILYGDEYLSAYIITIICTVGTIFMVFIKMISQYNIVHKKQLTNTLLLVGAVFINIIMNIWLVPDMGILGTAIASLVSHFICGFSFAIFFVCTTNIKMHRILFICPEDLDIMRNMIKRTKK